MKTSLYINGTGCVAPQNTKSKPLFEEVDNEAITSFSIVKPNYRDYIAPTMIRRMGKAIKMGVVAAKDALAQAQIENVEAIITGTGLGCQQDSEKFLENILNNEEQFLTPTSFIQSTHNTVAGQIALMLQCKAYNFTYCHRGFSFENTLVDAEITFLENKANNILVMGIDEMTEHTKQVFQRIDYNVQNATEPSQLIENTHAGSIYGEGAAAFVVSNHKSETTKAEIIQIDMLYKPSAQEVEKRLQNLAEENNFDLILAGYSGDKNFDAHYPDLETIFPDANIGAFKHLVGEYHTASSFATWLAAEIINDNQIPKAVLKTNKNTNGISKILIYNHYNNLEHSFITISK